MIPQLVVISLTKNFYSFNPFMLNIRSLQFVFIPLIYPFIVVCLFLTALYQVQRILLVILNKTQVSTAIDIY